MAGNRAVAGGLMGTWGQQPQASPKQFWPLRPDRDAKIPIGKCKCLVGISICDALLRGHDLGVQTALAQWGLTSGLASPGVTSTALLLRSGSWLS